MSPVALTSTPDSNSDDLAGAMRRLSIHSVPVLDHGRLIGIITRRDLTFGYPRARH